MTWKEFVEAVEKEMEKNNIPPDTDIFYIDLSMPRMDELRVINTGDGLVVD